MAPVNNSMLPDLIPKHGGFRKLRSFQVAQQVYDATVIFCNRFIERRSRTHDQMVYTASFSPLIIRDMPVPETESTKNAKITTTVVDNLQ